MRSGRLSRGLPVPVCPTSNICSAEPLAETLSPPSCLLWWLPAQAGLHQALTCPSPAPGQTPWEEEVKSPPLPRDLRLPPIHGKEVWELRLKLYF